MKLLLSIFLAGLVAAIDPPRKPHQPLGNGTKLVAYNETSSAALRASSVTIDWVSFGEDGQYIFTGSDGALTLQNVVTGDQDVFVPASQVPTGYHEYWIKPDLTKVLWSTNYTKQYRHSYFADYLILNRESGALEPLDPTQNGDIQYAAWSPVGETIAFVRGNNLFLWKNGTISQITKDGGPDKFNGVPDWVLEEEIFGDRFVLWFSPDGDYVAYLSVDETGVPTYTVPYYTNRNAPGTQAPFYPNELEIRYPKVGQTNPKISFNLLNVNSLESSDVPIDAFPAEDLIIGEVAWVTDDHSHVVYRAYNRVQDQEKIVAVTVDGRSSSVVHERDGTDGWLDNNLAITYLGHLGQNATQNGTSAHTRNIKRDDNATYYLDLSDKSGWNHLYLFPVLGGAAIALTSGDWEVTDILKVDTTRQLIYYLSTQGHSTERHLYSVSYATHEVKALVDDKIPAYWGASFSSSGTYYVLSYLGPDVPYQELYSVNSTTPIRVVTDNKKTYDNLQAYKLPNITYSELKHPDGYSLNAMLRLPANFSPDKKYPVLFTPYGGPGAQEVSKRFQAISWRTYISSDPELEYITLTVDNRGTGFKGRAFRATVASRLGKLEAEDQIWAATELAKQPWVDAEKIGIWGWSFGGYLSSKVVEADSGVFSLGLITAPVSDWRFYDSMYTERYMKTYAQNAAGYNESSVHRSTGFKNIAGGFLIQHGTGDDNVHFQHTTVLVDFLMGERVSPEKMQAQFFTDSDHGISYHNDGVFLYRQLTKKLYEEKNRVPGQGGGHQWSRRRLANLKKEMGQ